MATLLPIIQFFDNNGDLLRDGLIYCYQAKTSTLQSAYIDYTASTPLENPILLDDTGRPQTSGSIWLLGSYTLIITDVNGNIVNAILDTVISFNVISWAGLTATIAQINALGASIGAAGTVLPSAVPIVDVNKSISGFNKLTGGSLIANTGINTFLLDDTHGDTAVIVGDIASQVNAVKIIPNNGGPPIITAFGSDTNINLIVGLNTVYIADFTYPTKDGTTGQYLGTNAHKVLSFQTDFILQTQIYMLEEVFIPTNASLAFYTSAPLIQQEAIFTVKTLNPKSDESVFIIKVNVDVIGVSKKPCLLLNTSGKGHPALAATIGTSGSNISLTYIMHNTSLDPITFYLAATDSLKTGSTLTIQEIKSQ